MMTAVSGGSASAQNVDDLRDMSIGDLAEIDVSSVTKSAGALGDAPAAIYVITHDDIARSGATTVPEILRLAPNLHVVRTGSSSYIVTAHGLSGSSEAQNFANKLLVLIDGRSVYTPLYSGVYWDMQDVLPDDIDRIEVISGPGATLWGANAVNGVINIITRKSSATQGILAVAGAGDRARDIALRYGAQIREDLSYRVYAKAHSDRQRITATGDPADDETYRVQGGFRVDWSPSTADMLTFQGDAYSGEHDRPAASDERISGHNLLGRWNRIWDDGATLQVQTYYDHTSRTTEHAGGRLALDMIDLDIQHSFALGRLNQIVWGGGVRGSRYRIFGSDGLAFSPPKRNQLLSNIFVQDSIAISPTVTAVLGLKLEDDPYAGATWLPSARLSWKIDPRVLLWAAASRAVRSPTPFDRDVVETLNGSVFLIGPSDFRSEKLDTFEAGMRVQPSSRVSLSVSAFYNDYKDLRSIEFTPVTLLPLKWGNELGGHSYGFDAWAEYQLAPWWRMAASYSLLEQDFAFTAAGSGLLGVAQLGDDPKHRASLKSFMKIGGGITFDTDLRYVSRLPDPRVKAFVEMGARIGWSMSDRINIAFTGFNLLHKRHLEFPAPDSNAVPRSFFVELKWRP